MDWLKRFNNLDRSIMALSHTTLWGIIILLGLPCLNLSCANTQMSVEQAKKVTISMSGQSFAPPPRSINDIMAVLNDNEKPDAKAIKAVNKLKATAAAEPPQGSDKNNLAKFYQKRADANFSLGLHMRGIQDYRKSYKLMQESGVFDIGIEAGYAMWEAWSGDINEGIAVLEKHVRRSNAVPQAIYNLQYAYIQSGNLKAAEEIKKSKQSAFNGSSPYLIHSRAKFEFISLEAEGKYKEAEPHIRKAISLFEKGKIFRQFPGQKFYDINLLIINLLNQHKYVEAEMQAREGIKEALKTGGNNSVLTALLIERLSDSLIRQGRLEDAIKLCKANIRIWKNSDFPVDSWPLAKARVQLGIALAAQGNFSEAMNQFKQAENGLINNTTYFANKVERDPQVILSHIMTGNVDDALETANRAYEDFRAYLGECSYQTAEMLALRGMSNIRKDDIEQAVADFLSSIPIILNNNQKSNDFLAGQRLNYIVEDYLKVLSKIYNTPAEKKFKINASEEAFVLMQAGSGNLVKRAISASSVRAAVDPELADLVRKEQDALMQLSAFQATLANALYLPPGEQNQNALDDLRAKIGVLENARNALLKEINIHFPKYSDYANPKPVAISMVQQHLLPDEALITIYPASERIYVWAIPGKGGASFVVKNLGKNDLQNIVVRLRAALAPRPVTFEDIPEFDLSSAYKLYDNLLKPVEKSWKGANNLIIIAHGALGQLPFSVLPVAPVKLGNDGDVLFANYRKLPWLIRKTSITRLPTASSFIALRSLPKGRSDRKPFVGFGDPIFNEKQLTPAENESTDSNLSRAKFNTQLQMRGIRITDEGNLDNDHILSCKIGKLDRLPDTADEIRGIARALKADLNQDIFLGKRASEHQVKTMDLSNRRIIAFASHGLVPGDLDGLHQPAIALSAPSVTGDNEDGLLTLDEILRLKLNADWVVLSACNTGAADGAGAEAVSGLGKAFFYAGTRSILVSMWPVETTSARKLTTGLFRYQQEDNKLLRASALRESMLDLIDGPGLKDDTTGKIIASYAHPLFWAPFIIVGDSIDVARTPKKVLIPLESSSSICRPHSNPDSSAIGAKIDAKTGNLSVSSSDTQVAAISDGNQLNIEPWTGIWKVEGHREFNGRWAMRQTDNKVVSTPDSLYEFNGVSQGNQLKGRIKGDYSESPPFSIFIFSDGQSFEGKIIWLGGLTIRITGRRIE